VFRYEPLENQRGVFVGASRPRNVQTRFSVLLGETDRLERSTRWLPRKRENYGAVTVTDVPLGALGIPRRWSLGELVFGWDRPIETQPTLWTPTTMRKIIPECYVERCALAAAGIRGIRYLDGNSRNRPLRDIKRDFLEALPENAEFEDVAEAIQDGAFNPQQVAFLDALKADDWFGFDYPAQAISAALSDKIGNWDASQTLIDSIAPLRGDVTYNYVIFDGNDIEIIEENGRPVSAPALFSSASPRSFRADLISSFSKPTNQHTYEYTDERREKIVTVLNKHGLRSVSSPELGLATRRFEKATGTAVVYYRGGEKKVGGFTSPDFADVILINADSPRILANTLAHELAHAAQKDKNTDTDGLLAGTIALLSETELNALQQKLLPFYPEDQANNEIVAYLMGDSVTGEDHLGLTDLKQAEQIKELYTAFFDSMGVLNPSGLKEVSDNELLRLGASPSPTPEDSAAIQQALSSMRPIYRRVFEAVNDGMTPEQVMAKFSLPEKAVANILNAVRSRIATAMSAAADPSLSPAMREGKFDGGRPDLALSTIPEVAAVDQIRNESDIPGTESWADVVAEAENRLRADYAGEYDRMLALAKNQKQMDTLEVAITKLIIARETMEGRAATKEERVKLAMLIHGYRDVGTETARALAIRRDPHKSPAERHAQFIAEALFTPDEATRKTLRNASPGQQADILASWMARVDAIKAELKHRGLDLDASLAASASAT
jgi:hypothetical protein